MIDLGKKNILGVLVNAIDYEATTERIIAAAMQRHSLTVTALAVHGVMTGVLDAVHRYRLNHFDIVTPDGQPVRWALAWLHGVKLTDRVYGPNLMLRVCKRAEQEGLPIFLYGSRPPIIQALADNLLARYPRLLIVGKEPSLFRQGRAEDKKTIIEKITSSRAAITFVGLGCPRQEIWAYEYRTSLCMPIIAVGAAFDFHAGNLPQAPRCLQNAGLEWLYRLSKEPKRLWKRYLLLNPLYIWYLFLQKIALKAFDPNDMEQPSFDMNYL